jgi:hypothetical protein
MFKSSFNTVSKETLKMIQTETNQNELLEFVVFTIPGVGLVSCRQIN